MSKNRNSRPEETSGFPGAPVQNVYRSLEPMKCLQITKYHSSDQGKAFWVEKYIGRPKKLAPRCTSAAPLLPLSNSALSEAVRLRHRLRLPQTSRLPV